MPRPRRLCKPTRQGDVKDGEEDVGLGADNVGVANEAVGADEAGELALRPEEEPPTMRRLRSGDSSSGREDRGRAISLDGACEEAPDFNSWISEKHRQNAALAKE